MIVIDEDNKLIKAEGNLEQICTNVAALQAMLILKVIAEEETDEGYDLIERMTEAIMRTVMDVIEDEGAVERIVNACRTIGATGQIESINYSIGRGMGVVS